MELSEPYWTSERRELISWFDERAPTFTAGYVAAVTLLHSPGFPARVHLVCHLVRDIYRRLPEALGDNSGGSAPAEVYPGLVHERRSKWTRSQIDHEPEPPGADRLVSAQVFAALKKLMTKSIDLGDQPSVGTRLARALFGALDRPPGAGIPGWVFRSFDEEYKFFVSRAHLAAGKAPTDEGLLTHFEQFERAFHSMVGPYFRGKEELDAILDETNRPAD